MGAWDLGPPLTCLGSTVDIPLPRGTRSPNSFAVFDRPRVADEGIGGIGSTIGGDAMPAVVAILISCAGPEGGFGGIGRAAPEVLKVACVPGASID